MNDALKMLVQRREELVRQSTAQRERLLASRSQRELPDGVFGLSPVSPVALVLARFGPWLQPAAMVAVPLLLVAVLRRPGSLLRAARWVLPVWQGYRTAQRWLHS